MHIINEAGTPKIIGVSNIINCPQLTKLSYTSLSWYKQGYMLNTPLLT